MISPYLAVVAFGPVVAAGRGVDKLRADAQSRAGAAYAAFEHVTHAELARDLFHVDRAVLVDEGRVAGDHEQPVDAGEPGDQILGQAVGEMLLIRVAAQIVERQHRNGRLVRQRKHGRRRGRRLADWRRFSDEAVTAAVQRLDIPRPPRMVAERLAQFLDARHQRGIAHGDLGPHRAEQLLLGDDLAGTAGHVGQQRKGLGGEPHLAVAGHQSDARLKTVAPERKGPIRHAFLRRRG